MSKIGYSGKPKQPDGLFENEIFKSEENNTVWKVY